MTLSLTDDVNVIINLSPIATPRNAFDLGLIVGPTDVITTEDRVQEYTNVDDMLTDGFTATDPEYLAALLYFAQSPQPTKVLIGRQDADSSGGGESLLEAIQACRIINGEWYPVFPCDATKADIEEIALYVETAVPSTVLFALTSDAEVLANTAGNIAKTLTAANYRRTLLQYSTTDYAAAAIMGYAMGANTGLINSAYTLKFKQEVGVTAEVLTSTQVTNIEADNCNVYVNRGSYYDMLEQGVMADATFFDEVINLDKLANDIQLNIMDALYQNPKVPQTEGGMGILKSTIIEANEQALKIGFIAPGIWTGSTILGLKTGDTLLDGYAILSEPIADQAQADREAREAPAIYNCIKLAGSVHSAVIQVNVNR